MLGFQKYLNKLYDVHWIFDEQHKKDLEDLMFVEFEQKDGYFCVKKFKYTYVDLLLGLEELDFKIKKTQDTITLKIINL